LDEASQNVYEGLSSNFFAFDKQSQSVVTAPLNSVLQGTILKVVLAVCEKQKIPIEFKFPNLKEIDHWEGAFITSKDLFFYKKISNATRIEGIPQLHKPV
jgi:branched-subunit amino acid aminotransferase/4-amino-4-deoxychorismate lyase